MISTSEVKEVNVFIINQLLECVRRVLFPAVRCAVNFGSCDRDRELKTVVRSGVLVADWGVSVALCG